jgi:hypothetical protein
VLAGPADTMLPVAASGDFNAEITDEGDASARMLEAGFETHGRSPGLGKPASPAIRTPTCETRSRI